MSFIKSKKSSGNIEVSIRFSKSDKSGHYEIANKGDYESLIEYLQNSNVSVKIDDWTYSTLVEFTLPNNKLLMDIRERYNFNVDYKTIMLTSE